MMAWSGRRSGNTRFVYVTVFLQGWDFNSCASSSALVNSHITAAHLQDDERALLEELTHIKAEREAERRKKEAEEATAAQSRKQSEVAAGNPLLFGADFGVSHNSLYRRCCTALLVTL